MNAANAMAADGLQPRQADSLGTGATLALVVHAGLIAALSLSIDWRSHAPDTVAAELWASVPQTAAPRPETPAPQPAPAPPAPPAPAPPPRVEPRQPEPDIAAERAERRRREQQAQIEEDRRKAAEKADADKKELEKKELEKRRRDQEAARDAQAAEQRLAQQREANLRRIMGEAGAAAGSAPPTRTAGTAANDAAPSAAYAGRIAALVRRNSVFTGSVSGNPAAEVEVTAAPGGTIIARRLVTSSGSKDWDDAVLQAIDKVGTLPRDTDGRVPARMIIAFRPKE